MKKKLFTILTVLVLAVVTIVATACGNGTLFEKNNERDMLQLTASVKYAGRASQVTKNELNSAMYNYAYQYYYYYQMGYITESSYKTFFNNLDTYFGQENEVLAKSEAYTLKCIDILYNDLLENGTEAAKNAANMASTKGKAYNVAERITEIETILSPKYLADARKAYNEDLQKAFDEYREAYETELEQGARTSKSTENIEKIILDTENVKKEYEKGASAINLNGLKVSVKYKDVEETVSLDRSDYTVTGFDSSAVKEENEITVTFGGVTETFTVKIVAAKPSRPVMPTDEADADDEEIEVPDLFETILAKDIEDAHATDLAEYKVLKEAKRRLEQSFESTYRSYSYYYLEQLKTQVVNEVEAKYTDGITEATGAEIQTRYESLVSDQLESLKAGASGYGDAMTSSDNEGYKTQVVHTDEGYFYVQHIVFNITDDLKAAYTAAENEKTLIGEPLDEYYETQCNKIGVYISNVEYDKNAECENEDCDCRECENYKGEGPFVCDGTCTCKQCLSKRFVNEDFAENIDKYVSADGFVFDDSKVNEDGTINVLEVIRAMYADLGAVTAESDIAARQEIIEKFKKWAYMCSEDTDAYYTLIESGKPGYALGKTKSSYVSEFTALARALAYGTDADKYEIHGSGVGSYALCYTKDFGIHVIMLTGYAVDPENSTSIEDGKYFINDADAIASITVYEDAEEGNVAEGTIAANIGKLLVEEKKAAAKGAFKQNFYQTELEDEKVTTITYYDKVFKDLIEAYNV